MNIQAMMRQAQKMQKDMMNEKDTIDKMIFEGKSSMISVQMNGKKELLKVKIDADSLEKDDIEMIEDMLVVAVNNAAKQVDQETEKRMGKFTQGMLGLF